MKLSLFSLIGFGAASAFGTKIGPNGPVAPAQYINPQNAFLTNLTTSKGYNASLAGDVLTQLRFNVEPQINLLVNDNDWVYYSGILIPDIITEIEWFGVVTMCNYTGMQAPSYAAQIVYEMTLFLQLLVENVTPAMVDSSTPNWVEMITLLWNCTERITPNFVEQCVNIGNIPRYVVDLSKYSPDMGKGWLPN